MGHIVEILDGIETPIPHDDEGTDGGRMAELESQYPDNVVKTFIVCESPERMEDFEKLVDKFCKKE